jgi:hypothetical protein
MLFSTLVKEVLDTTRGATGIMVVITITLTMMVRTVALLHGMDIIGMRGFLTTA